MATFRENPDYADATPGATGRFLWETAAGLPRGVAPIIVTPEQHGAIGDGVASDTGAFNAAIADAVGSGKLLQGNPAKTYVIGTSLNSFGGTLRIADCHFRAPNGVRVLLGDPTWPSENATITGVTTVAIGQSTVTRVQLTSTSGIVPGTWVLVGSSTLRWPGNAQVYWFEAAQVVAVSTNASIDLHRRLLGEERGVLTSSLRLFRVPDYRLEARDIRFSCSGDPFATGQSNRQFAVELRGGVGHKLIRIHADSWWSRLLVLRAAMLPRLDSISWEGLPDITSPSIEALGYGVQCEAGCYGAHIKGIAGGRCRHGYTSSGFATATYDAALPWRYGLPTNAAVDGGLVTGASGAAFDTHAESVGDTFQGCTSGDPVHSTSTNAGEPCGFQNRGFCCRFSGCSARGGDHGFVDRTAQTNWGSAGVNVAEYVACSAGELDGAGVWFEGTQASTTILVNGLTVTNAQHALQSGASSPFAGTCLARALLTSALSGSTYQNGGHTGTVTILD